jgi:intracellular septation protein
MTESKASQAAAVGPLTKLALELGPLGLFFLANSRPHLFAPLLAPFLPPSLLAGANAGIFAATAVFMVAVIVALAASYWLTRRVPVMPVVSGIVVIVFGGLTLFLQDDLFIKLKPTIVNALFGTVLLGGLAFGRPLLALVFDAVFTLTDEGWRKLTLRWGLFFFVLAALNEIVWRTQTTDVWVSFKVFAIMPLTFVFAALQYPLLVKYEARGEGSPAEP